ncbi:MAG: type I-E CRISPR-associated protein Cse2/CasB [Bowdeniella nasicola]|nr:type I-E CRISPR-associated protein Cse2/CasB [Bowdeniella nasicola]
MTDPELMNQSYVGRLVEARLTRLQSSILGDNSRARAQMAALRHAISEPPGSNPEIWELTAVPRDHDCEFDAPTYREIAVHHAMCLYAIHQQSKSSPMHVASRPFATAIRKLSDSSASGSEISPVQRRFEALVTSSSERELVHHARGLVGQLRSADLGFDYGGFANDLYRYQLPGGPAKVRLQWARIFSRLPQTEKPTDTTSKKGSTNA